MNTMGCKINNQPECFSSLLPMITNQNPGVWWKRKENGIDAEEGAFASADNERLK